MDLLTGKGINKEIEAIIKAKVETKYFLCMG
jgi:hypothetical protein